MSLSDIASIMEKYGFKGSIFIVFIFILISMLKSSWFTTFLGKLSDSFVEKFMRNKVKDVNSHVKSIADSDITNHDIFNYIDFWTYSKVPTIQFSTEYRTAVFRKYLTIYLKSYKRKISDFVNSKEYQDMDDAKVWKALLDLINQIVQNYSIHDAGIWDAVNRLSSFYMMFFSSGLSLYYMPKLASIHTEKEFKAELKSYFKIFVPLFLLMLIVIYFAKSIILNVAFTREFSGINEVLIWQLAGDFIKIITLAFGFQIVVKTMMKRYFIGEIAFNLSYFLLAVYLMKKFSVEGVLQAYFYANLVCLVLVLFMFRKLFFKR